MLYSFNPPYSQVIMNTFAGSTTAKELALTSVRSIISTVIDVETPIYDLCFILSKLDLELVSVAALACAEALKPPKKYQPPPSFHTCMHHTTT